MTDSIVKHLRYAIHAPDAWTTEPSGQLFLEPAEKVIFWPGPEYNHIDRDGVERGNSEMVPGLRGVENSALPDLVIEGHGLSGGGALDGVPTAAVTTLESGILESVMGAVVNSDGETSDGTDAGTGTDVIMDAASNFDAGEWLAAKNTTGNYQIRQVNGASVGASVPICRTLTTSTGAVDDALEAEVVAAGRGFYLDNDNHNPPGLFFRAEYESREAKFLGCYPESLAWNLTSGQILKLTLGGLSYTEMMRLNPVSATYVAPVTGSKIVCTPIYMWVGSTLMMAHDITITVTTGKSRRRFDGLPTGHFGFARGMPKATISGKISYGDLTAPTEMTEALMASWQGAGKQSSPTFDVMIQAGCDPGFMQGWRAQNAQFTSLTHTDQDGLDIIDFSMTCYERTDHATTQGSLSTGIF